MLSRLLRSIDPILAVGVTFSIALAVVLVLIGQDQVTSLLIGLVVTTITLLIDTLGRQKDSEQRIVEAFELGRALSSNPRLIEITRQITEDYHTVEKLASDPFPKIAEETLVECKEVIHGLAEGRYTASDPSKYFYGAPIMNAAARSAKAVAYGGIDWWKREGAEAYVISNIEAVKRGVRVVRVWVYRKNTLLRNKDVIERQEKAGIVTYITTPQQLSPNLLEDYMVVDERLLIKLESTLGGGSKATSISTDPNKVKQALSNFEAVLSCAKPFDVFFASNTQEAG